MCVAVVQTIWFDLMSKLGEVRPEVLSIVVHSSEGLQRLITGALLHRRTSETLRNKDSSRSHALLTIITRCCPMCRKGS